MHVLVVEDDDTTAKVVESVLQREGWVVTRVATVEGAKEELVGDDGSQGVDAVVLDHVLPDGTGLELLIHVSNEDALLPVVFLTGEGDEEVAFRALSHGAMDYLVKGEDPVPEELRDRLSRAVARWSELGGLELVEGDAGGPGRTRRPGGREGGEGSKTRGEGGTSRPPARIQQDYDDLDDLLEAVEAEERVGCAVYDAGGTLLSASLPEDANERGMGTLSVDVSRHVSALALATGRTPRRHFLLVDTEEGIVGSSIVPGPLIFVMLFPRDVDHEEALRRLKRTARRVWDAGGSDPAA